MEGTELQNLTPNIAVAVIGCNLSAVMALSSLHKINHCKLTWALAPKENFDADNLLSVWLPEQAIAHLPEIKDTFREIEPTIFYNGHQHEKFRDFLRQPQTEFSQSIPISLRQKIESLSMWNDLTPLPIHFNEDINFHWPSQNPDSFNDRKNSKFYLVNRTELLKQAAKSTNFNLHLESLSLDQGNAQDKLKIIFKAPNAWQAFDGVLWTSQQCSPKVEKGSSLKIKQRKSTPVARWRTYSATLNRHIINALPEASIWLPSTQTSNRFLKTGDVGTGSIYRVFKPSIHSLQIDVLEMGGERSPEKRPDNFLWTFCPSLKEQSIEWKSCVLDENLIYETPFPILHEYKNGFEFWSGGPFSNFARTLELKALWANHKIHAGS